MQKIFLYGFPVLALILVGSFLYLTRIKPSLSPFNPKPTATNTSNNNKPGAPGSKLPAASSSSLDKSTATRFRGTIAKIEGPILTVNGRLIYNQTASASGSAIQTGPIISAKVTVGSATQITSPSNSKMKPATTSATTSTPTKLSLQDLKVGQSVSISSSVDLKGLKTTEFTAKTITLVPSATAVIKGKITAVKGDAFTLEAQTGSYDIILTKETSISTSDIKNPASLSQADLKVNREATVYTKDDLYSSPQITALRIQL